MNPRITIQDWRCGANDCGGNELFPQFITFKAGKVTDIGGNCCACCNWNHVEVDGETGEFPAFSLNFED